MSERRHCRTALHDKLQIDLLARLLAAEVGERHGLSLTDIRKPRRAARYAHPRHEAMWELWETGRYSSITIARFLGLTNHTSVYYGWREHRRRAGIV